MAGIVVRILFVRRQLSLADPMIDVRLLSFVDGIHVVTAVTRIVARAAAIATQEAAST